MKKTFISLEDFNTKTITNQMQENYNNFVVLEASNCSFNIYIPNRDKNSKLIDEVKLKYWIHDFRQRFLNCFGCVNQNDVKTLYKNNNLEIIIEDTIVLSAFNFQDNKKCLDAINEIVYTLVEFGYDTNQETVLYIINNQPRLIRL